MTSRQLATSELADTVDRQLDHHAQAGNITSWAFLPTEASPHRRVAVLRNMTDLEMLTTRDAAMVARALSSAERAAEKRRQALDKADRAAARPSSDQVIATVTPRLQLVVDASGCIVLRSEHERHTIGDAGRLAVDLDAARITAGARHEQAETAVTPRTPTLGQEPEMDL
jgi:hypothetical protein